MVASAPGHSPYGTLTAKVTTDTNSLGTGGVISWSYTLTPQQQQQLQAAGFTTYSDVFAVTVADQFTDPSVGTWTQDVTVQIIEFVVPSSGSAHPVYFANGNFHDLDLLLSWRNSWSEQ